MIYQSILISLLWSSLIVYRPVWCNSHPSYHLVSLFIPTPTLKHYCIWAIVTGLTLLMSRNKSCFGDVSCFSAALSDPTLLSGSCSQDLHYIYPGITVLTDPPPPPVSFTTIVSMVTGKTVLLSLLLHCSFHPKQHSPLIKIPLLYLSHDALHISK